MNRQTRFTALLLAVSLLCNMALPVMAEGSVDTPILIEETTAPTAETSSPSGETATPSGETATPSGETATPSGETAYFFPQYQSEGNTLEITSAQELVMLSYINPQEYQALTLEFCPGEEENAGFDLLSVSGDLPFLGLGSEEYPFQGEIQFDDQAGPIALNRPLFNVLSDDAKITGLSLESHVQGIAEGGLLAKSVTHCQGGNTWTVTLAQPQSEENTEFNLLPLIYNLADNADVSLSITDLSGLPVLGSGYLCAVMGENAQLALSGIDTIPAVTGNSDAVGGLVGLMKSGASLTVLGESIRVSDVNGNWNSGGIVGSATDPLLSLPSVVGCDGAVIGGINVGGVIGRLVYTPGDHVLSVSLSNLTLEGSDNVGGFIGVLLRDEGTLTLDARAEGIVFAEGAIYCGSLFGTYYTSSPENPLVLNGEPIAEDAELEALAGLADYPGKPEIIFTVEDAQAIIDSILSAELRPGEMSPLWWAVVSGKLNAEELAAQLNAYYSGAEETEPTEATQAQEDENLPQEPTQGEAAAVAEMASFSPQAEDNDVSSAEASTEPASIFLESLISSYATDPTPPWPTGKEQFGIESVQDLVLLSYVAQSTYENGTVTVKVTTGSIFDLTKSYNVTSNGQTYPELSFQGLGNETNPFSGSFTLDESCSNLVIKLNRPLFNALSDTATLSTLNLRSSMSTQPDAPKAALLAEKVCHPAPTPPEGEASSQAAPKNWSINLQGIKGYSLPLIGTIGENSSVSVTVSSLTVGTVSIDENGNDVDSSFPGEGGNASDLTVLGGGFLCSTMESGASLTVTGISEIPAVENASGNAGGLVGTMESGAALNNTGTTSLTLSAITATNGNAGGLIGKLSSDATVSLPNLSLTLANITATGSDANGNAGGLVGYAENPDLSNLPSISNTTSVTISGRSAGGLVGWLNHTNDNTTFSLNKTVSNITLSGSESSGGLFGELHNDKSTDAAPISYTLSAPTETSGEEGSQTTSPRISNISLERGSAGGLIGKYYTNDLANTLTISNVSVTSSSSATNYGGVIGYVDGSNGAAYIALTNITSESSGKPTNLGGLIGGLSDHGHFVNIGTDISITHKNDSKQKLDGSEAVGGLIGYMNSGVLYLTAAPSFGEMTHDGDKAEKRGWILGERRNVLVYTDVEWTPNTGNDTNDTGSWGQVLRVDDESPLKTGLLSLSNHTLTVKALTTQAGDDTTNSIPNGSILVNDEVDFAAVALRIQLDSIGALQFEGNDPFVNTGSIALYLKRNISLESTGLTGLTRDVSQIASDVASPVFSYNITGVNSPSITLPSYTVYTSVNSNDSNVRSHDRQGLIGIAGETTIKNVTVTAAGEGITVKVLNKATYSGIVAELAGDITLENVTSSVKWNITQSNGECRLGGMVGQNNVESKSLTFKDCTWNGSIIVTAGDTASVGGFLARSNANNTQISFTGCKVFGSINAPGGSPEVGGLVGVIWDKTGNTISIDGLQVKATIDVKGNNCGLLAFQWFKTAVLFSGVQVYGSSLNSNGNAFGGLVYRGSGFWQVSNTPAHGDNNTTGISFQLEGGSTVKNKFTGASTESEPSALIVCRGDNNWSKGALYLEIEPEAYQIVPDSIDLSGVSSSNFDEIIGVTENNKGNGIVSYATKDHARFYQGNETTTYVNQVATDKTNKKARYYYNLDLFRSRFTQNTTFGSDYGKLTGAFGDIDTSEKMVLWSAYSHCDDSLKDYFARNITKTITNPTSGDNSKLDLAGYSFYPVPFDGTRIENATITFDYDTLMEKEAGNKLPTNNTSQHSGMHTGIFTNKLNAENTGAGTLFVNNLTLSGTVGGSAILNGTARGNGSGSDEMMKLSLTKITLDGIRTSSAASALLIDSIGSFTSMQLTDITTTNAYQSLTDFTHAATSLIGVVGEISGDDQVGQYIQLDFAQIALDGRISADANSTTVHNTTRSIFSEALFLQEFQYADANSWGIYNFTKPAENEEKKYTLGVELSNSETDENVRNGGEQFYFYGSTTDYVYLDVNPNAATDGSEATTFFKNTYRRYVGNTETGKQHEMDINLLSPNVIEGCGTYSHPYIITNGKQLLAVANVLKGANPKKGWTITLNTTVLTKGFSSQASHADNDDKEYSWNEKWIDENGVDLNSDTNTGKTQVINYLRNAYYLLRGNDDNNHIITLSSRSGWGGLGSKTNPFCGVIVGDNEENCAVIVHINAPSATQFGGLIAFSTGSVVKNVNIQYDHAPSIACTSAPSTIDAPFFGGVVGWCVGGDTIIDKVTVTYQSSPTVTGNMAYLLPVGGYVGLVGGTEGMDGTTNGKGGGVVFRGTNTSNLSSVSVGGTSVNPSADTNYFYVNPYVGRVLDGYAVTEGSEFINTDKNYKIPSISSPGLSIDDSGNIEVSNDAGLWLLSAIVNSGAASTANGKARVCNYSSVGQTMPDGEGADEESGASPYLIRKYGLELLKTNISAGAVSIELTGNCNMTNYGNGFRGIGTSYSANDNYTRLIKVNQLDGGSKEVTLAQNRKEYLDEGSNWTSIGTGLFVRLYQDSSSNPTTIKNLTLTGSTGITYYNGTGLDTNTSNGVLYKAIKDNNLYSTRLNQVGAGMLASSVANVDTTDLTIENVTLNEVKVNSEEICSVFAGGMIGVICGGGSSNSNDYLTVTLNNCAYTNLNVRGFVDAGGFIGRVKANDNGKFAEIVITYSKNASLTGGDIKTTSTAYERDSNFSTVGGLIGCTYYYNLVIRPSESSNAMLTISDLKVNSNYSGSTGDRVFGGGLVGLCYTPKTDCTIQNVTFKGNNSISGADSANRRQLLGGLIGTLTNKFGWNDSGSASVTVSNVHIAESGSLKLQYTQQTGALFGILNIGGKIQLRNITIGSDGNSPSVMIANIKNDGNYSNIGGLIGGGNALKDVSLNDVQINHTYVLLDNNTGKTRGAALLFGFIENGSDTASIKIQNLTLKNSYVVTGNQQTRAGFMYGFLNNQNSSAPSIVGRNVLIENCQLGYNSSLAKDTIINSFTLPNLATDGTAAGLIGGDCTNSHTSVKLVGVRVKGCTAPAQNFGTTNPKDDSYVIRADYSEAATKASEIISVPTSSISIKDTDNNTTKKLASDGACFTASEPTMSIAEKIMRDYLNGATCNSYFGIGSAITKFASKSEEAVTISEMLSTFHTAGEVSDDDKKTVSNFPVLVINSNEGSKANSIVQNFITVLTNDTVAPRSISAATYKWSANSEAKKGAFTKVTDASLTVASDGTVSITPGAYDNQRNQFTLLDVAYNDPTGTKDANGSSIVYHLYIPVIVRKIMAFKFRASAENGSSYNAGKYAKLSQTTLASNKELVTSLLTFQYQWDASQWQIAVDTGTYLLWNFDKEISLHTMTSKPIPSGTRMTLVDRNNQDKAYYATYSDSKIKFSAFHDGEDKWTWASSTFLCDLLKLTATSEPNGKFAQCGKEDDKATLRIKGDNGAFQYYRPAETSDQETFNIQVGLGEGALAEETYFLTFQTNKSTSTGPYHFLIECNPRLTIPTDLPAGKTGLPTIIRPYAGSNTYASDNENRVIINDFFTQQVTVSTGESNQEMSPSEGSGNDTIRGTLTTTIKFPENDNDYAYGLFDGQIGTRTLKQQFCLFLKDQAGNPVDFVDGTMLTVDGEPLITVEGSSAALWLPIKDVTRWGNEPGHPATITVPFELHYPTPESLMEQFPEGKDGEVGIQVWATSCLSMNEDALQRSNQRETANDDKLFYRTEVNLATMFYNAYDVDYPTQESGLSSLGINGWSTDNLPINSVALYNASALNKKDFAPKYLKCTVELLRKVSDVKYETVVPATDTQAPLLDYFSSIQVIPKVYVGSGYRQLDLKDGKFIFKLPDDEVSWHENVQIDVNFAVRYGSDFETKEHTYANYRVILSAELLDENKNRLSGTFAHDYIIYTNAKIRKELIS